MKIEIEYLNKIIQEELDKLKEEMHIPGFGSYHVRKDEEDYEARMFKSNLYSLSSKSQSIHDMTDDDENIEEWVQEKIAVADAMISSVYDYLKYEKSFPEKVQEQSDYVGMDPANYPEYDYAPPPQKRTACAEE